MLGRLGIRGKIFAVVAVPILVLFMVAGSVAFSTVGSYFSAQNTNQLLTVSQAVSELDAALQAERNAGANFVHAYPTMLDSRMRAQTNTDLAYAAVVAAAASSPPAVRAQANAALAQVDAVIQRFGYNSSGEFVDMGTAGDDRGLPAVRNVTAVINPILVPDIDEATGEQRQDSEGNLLTKEQGTDWPVWPTTAEMRQLERHYADTVAQLKAIATAAPVEAGMAAAVNYFASVVGVESVAAASFLTTPDTYLPPNLGEGGIAPPVPIYVATYQDAFLASTGPVDLAMGQLDDVMEQIGPRPENADVVAALGRAQELLTKLAEDREGVRDRSINFNKMTGDYADVIAALSDSQISTAGNLDDRTVAEALAAYVAIDGVVEAMRLEQITGERVLLLGALATADDLASYRELRVRTDAAMEAAQAATARVPGIPPLENFGISFDPSGGGDWDGVRSRLDSGDVEFAQKLGWTAKLNQEVAGVEATQEAVWARVAASSQSAKAGAFLQSLATLVGGSIVIVGSLVIALLIARRIVGPLRRLTTTATAVRQELPRLVERVALPGQTVDVSEVQIPVESSDEIGRLAEAFNAVNAATLAIAGEQAALRGSISEMFVNVARRDQVLLNRQLASIDEMERSQDDPGTLSKLFALDHLATRMRRNSESLLVLAGIDTGRRMRRPMPLSDVIRTASSEIELYERIQLELDADPSMVGHSALTAGHLFAEILENATVFSDPGSPVTVRTLRKDDSIVVEVVDLGIGMTGDELREANSRVMSTAASEILGAQRLGLFVVGRIARRLGARVEIHSEESKGATVTVTMPLSLFDPATLTEVGHASDSTIDDELHVPSALLGHRESEEEMDVYSDAVMSPAIAGAGLHVSTATVPVELEALIQADAEAAPISDEVDLKGLTEGTTERGLPSRRRRSTAKGEAKAETGNILGLPERPTTGQLAALKGEPILAFVPGEAAEAEPATAEQRSAMFRGFRARRGEESVGAGEQTAEVAEVAVETDKDVSPSPDDVAARAAELASFAPPVLEPTDVEVPDAVDAEPPSGEADSESDPEAASADAEAEATEDVAGASAGMVDAVAVEPTGDGAILMDPTPEVPELDSDDTAIVGVGPGWEISAGFEHIDSNPGDPDASLDAVVDLPSVPTLEPAVDATDVPVEPEFAAWPVHVADEAIDADLDSPSQEAPSASISENSGDEAPADQAAVPTTPFSWEAIPPASEIPEGAAPVIPADLFPTEPEPQGRKGAKSAKAAKEIPQPTAPTADAGQADQKERRSLFGRKKKSEADKSAAVASATPTEELSVQPAEASDAYAPNPTVGDAPPLTDEFAAPAFAEAAFVEPVFVEPVFAEPAFANAAFANPAATSEFDEWGLPIASAAATEVGTDGPAVIPAYDEWGLPVDGIPMAQSFESEPASIDLAADALAYEAPAPDAPTYDDISSLPLPEAVAQTGEIPDITVESLAQEPPLPEPAIEVDSPTMPYYLETPVADGFPTYAPDYQVSPDGIEAQAFAVDDMPALEGTPVAAFATDYAASDYATNGYAQPDDTVVDAAAALEEPIYATADYAQPDAAQPTYVQPDFPQPGYAQPEYAQPEYAQPEYAQPEYAQPEYAQPDYGVAEVPVTEGAAPSYVAPTYGVVEPAGIDLAVSPITPAIPSFDDLLAPAQGSPQGQIVPPMAQEPLASSGAIPELVLGSAMDQYATPEYQQPSTAMAFPGLEPDPVVAPVAPAVIDYGLPQAPPPPAGEYGYAAEPLPTDAYPQPAYAQPDAYAQPPYAAAPTDAPYGQGLYGAEDTYGTAVQGFSVDQFAHPYGWEEAGASALAAATVDQGVGGYSPQSFDVTHTAPDAFEADMTTEVFSELSSLSTARPKVVRTKAGLTRRAPTEAAEVGPTPIPEIDGVPVARDPEAVRANFAGFYSGTALARAESPTSDVHGGASPEVAP